MTRAVCVLGMHRSGTSLVARLLDELGIDFGGADELMAPNFANPGGYWEFEAIVRVHDSIFEELSRRWDTAFPLPRGWHRDSKVAPHRERLREIVQERFREREIFGWKDPRTSLLLPLWKDVLSELGIPVHFVLTFRHPLDVANSLARRDGFRARDALGLWFHYNLQILTETRGQERTLVRYEDLVDRDGDEIGRLAKALSLKRQKDSASAKAIIDPELCHHRSDATSLADPDRVPVLVASLYEVLSRTLCGESSGSELDATAEDFLRDFRRHAAVLAHDGHEARKQVRRLEWEAEELRESVGRLERYIDYHLAKPRQEAYTQTPFDSTELSDLDDLSLLREVVTTQTELMRDLREELEATTQERRRLAADLEEIHESRWWRLASGYWRFRRWLGFDR